MDPKVFIIVLNWNGYKDTIQCIESLQKITYANYKILLVDNGSTDGSQQILKDKFPHLPLIENTKNLGFATGNNIGINLALEENADYVLLLNNDTIVDEDFLGELVAYAEANKDVAALNPKIYYYDSPDKVWFDGSKVNLWTGTFKHIHSDNQNGEALEVGYAVGCALLMRTAVIREIGLLDDNFFAFCEDVDWSIRAKKQGYRCVCVPKSKIWHKVSAGCKKNEPHNRGRITPFQHYLNTRNKIFLIRKHANVGQKTFFYLAFLFNHLLYLSIGFILLRRWAKLISMWKGFFDGLRTKF